MPQTTYANYHSPAIAGQVVDGVHGYRKTRGRYEGSEDLNFGRLLELHTDGKLRHPQQTGSGLKILGGCSFNPVLPPRIVNGSVVNGYAAGQDIIPVFRRGQMWVEYTGTAPTVEAAPNVCHASDNTASNAQHRGKITGSATSTVAGSEIAAGPEGIVVIEVDTASSLALVEFNLPA